ncbi:glycosyl hydrolase [Lentilactobacillus curieae]|uniref:Glycosyl hydrolase n=1 Tax=Lentilactobacillus curieae TaxID=1138822 RepID=A0A1S6QH26_9LACO|nr:glycosyl hydrolase [Lentilactobacillus curieae]AQW20899.1 glycosyl hydrolase [Lentilactobacillus curieae]
MNSTSFTIDASELLTTSDANTFKGFGYINCNNSSRLLMDYKYEHPESYQQILATLFGGKHPVMRMLKVELGDDANTSSGTEPAPVRSIDGEANVKRGAGYQLIADVKRIQPDIKTALLRWGEPGFLRPFWTEVKSSDHDNRVPESAYEPMYQYYKKTIVAAYETYGFVFDYVNPDRNENKHPMYKWTKWFADRIKSDIDFPNGFPVDEYHAIKIIAADQNYETDFGDAMVADAELRDKVTAAGFHYNTDDSPDNSFTKLADEYHKEVWYSEGIAPMTFGKYRVKASNGDGIGGKQSGLDVANRVIKSYVKSRRSLYLFQPAVSAYYPGVNYSHKELISASRPWSGEFDVDNVGLQIIKHFTDFAKTGWEDCGAWRILTSASDSQVGGTENLTEDTFKPSYLTLMSPDKQDYSVIFVNDGPAGREYEISLKNIPEKDLDVWESQGPKSAEEDYDANLKRLRETIDFADVVKVFVPAHSIVTATTLKLADDNEVKYQRITSGKDEKVLVQDVRTNLLYSDDFSYSDYPADYLSRRGGTPRFTTDQGGAFEVVQTPEGNVLQQMITEKERALDWEYSYAPNFTLGDDHWTDYSVKLDFQFDNQTIQNTAYGNYIGIGLYEMTDVKGRLESAPYVFKLYTDGSYQLLKDDQVVNLGYVDGLDLDAHHIVEFTIVDGILYSKVDDKVLFKYVDDENIHYSGRIKIGTGFYNTKIHKITVISISGGVTVTKTRLDDLDDQIIYGGNWNHVCGLGNTIWNRSLSSAQGDGENNFKFEFDGTGFSLIGKQNRRSYLKVFIDGRVVLPSVASQKGADKSEVLIIHDLPYGHHEVRVVVTKGKFTLDAVDISDDLRK